MLFFLLLLFYWSELNVFKPIEDLDVLDGTETFRPRSVGSCSNDLIDDVFLIVKAASELVDDLDAKAMLFLKFSLRIALAFKPFLRLIW